MRSRDNLTVPAHAAPGQEWCLGCLKSQAITLVLIGPQTKIGYLHQNRPSRQRHLAEETSG